MQIKIVLIYLIAEFSFVVGMSNSTLIFENPIVYEWKNKTPVVTTTIIQNDGPIFSPQGFKLIKSVSLHVLSDGGGIVFVGLNEKSELIESRVYDFNKRKIIKDKKQKLDTKNPYYIYKLISIFNQGYASQRLSYFRIGYERYAYKYSLDSTGSSTMTDISIKNFSKNNNIAFQFPCTVEFSNQVPGTSDLFRGDLKQVLVLRDIKTKKGKSVLALFSLNPLDLVRIVSSYDKNNHLVGVNDDLSLIYMYDKSTGVLTKIAPCKAGLAINTGFNKFSNIYFETAE